jgi:hypothetical protein
MAGMAHRIVFGVLYLILAAWGIVTGIRQKRENKDFRLLFLLGFMALLAAAEKMWRD